MLILLTYLAAAAAGAALAGFAVARRPGAGKLAAHAADGGTLGLPKQSLAELQRFRKAVDSCVDSIYMIDRETLKFVDVSATASSHSGYSHEETMKMGPL